MPRVIFVGRRRAPERADLPHSEVATGHEEHARGEEYARGQERARGESEELAAILRRARDAGIDRYRVLAALGFDLSSLESSAPREAGATERRPPL